MGIIVKLAEKIVKKNKPASKGKEIGATGTEDVGGFLVNEEYMAVLRGVEGAKTYDKMRRVDSEIAGIIQAVTLPIRGAVWHMESFDDKPIARRVAHVTGRSLLPADGVCPP